MRGDSIGGRTLVGAIESHRQNRPAATFLEYRGQPLTYGDFGGMVARAANGLLDLGIGPGDKVLIQMQNCPEHLVAIFAVQRIGAINVTCSTLYKLDETAFQIADSAAVAAICGRELAERMRAAIRREGRAIPVLDADDGRLGAGDAAFNRLLAEGEVEVRIPMPGPQDLAMLLYTSGTTGRPKAAIYTHGNLVHGGQSSILALGYCEDDRLLHYFPFYHNNGGVILLAPVLLSGCCMVMVDKFSSSRFGTMLADHDVTLAALNATHIKMILAHPPTPDDNKHRVRRAQFALPLDRARRNAFAKRFPEIRLVEVYGQTETCGIITAVPTGAFWREDSAGLAMPNTEMKVTDEAGNALAPGEAGELCFRSITPHALISGYHNSPEQTAALYRDGWLRTGDIATIDGEGFMTYVDRLKDIIKRSGVNIAAAEIERCLLEHPGVAEAAVVGAPDAMRDEKIIAYVVSKTDASIDSAELEAHCRALLADLKVPQHFEIRRRMPENFLGKVEKRVLRTEAQRDFGD